MIIYIYIIGYLACEKQQGSMRVLTSAVKLCYKKNGGERRALYKSELREMCLDNMADSDEDLTTDSPTIVGLTV